ncbi:MAG: ParA family protein [Haloferacaceae archaeon]
MQEIDDEGSRDGSIVALAGATGGAGTTRTAVELATTLARDGRSAVVVDAAFSTQGLSEYVSGRIVPDVTALVTEASAEPVPAATIPFPERGPDAAGSGEPAAESFGSVELLPARAPFERLARAQTPAAAETFEALLRDAGAAFDHVIVDVPPVASNQAIAAVSSADVVVAVTPGSDHGRDALVRLRDRLEDLGVRTDAAVSVGDDLSAADLSLPETEPSPLEAPSCLEDDPYGEALVALAERAFDCTLSVEFGPDGVRDRVSTAVADRMDSITTGDS